MDLRGKAAFRPKKPRRAQPPPARAGGGPAGSRGPKARKPLVLAGDGTGEALGVAPDPSTGLPGARPPTAEDAGADFAPSGARAAQPLGWPDLEAGGDGDWTPQVSALDNVMRALEESLLSFTLWNYCSQVRRSRNIGYAPISTALFFQIFFRCPRHAHSC